jgi:hypothetical protein
MRTGAQTSFVSSTALDQTVPLEHSPEPNEGCLPIPFGCGLTRNPFLPVRFLERRNNVRKLQADPVRFVSNSFDDTAATKPASEHPSRDDRCRYFTDSWLNVSSRDNSLVDNSISRPLELKKHSSQFRLNFL